MFSGLFLCRNCLASETWDLQSCPEELTSRIKTVCLPPFSEPCKPIPRPHRNYLWGSRLWECVWEYRVPQCGHLVEVTFHCKRARSKELWAVHLLQKWKEWNKASAVRSEKTAIGRIFKQLLGRTTFRRAERKMGYLPSRSNIQVNTHGVSLQFPRNFHTDLGSLGFSYREMWWNRSLDFVLPFPVSMGIFPMVSGSGEMGREKWPSNKCFPAVCFSQHTIFWERYLLRKLRHQQSVFSGLCLAGTI